MAWTIKGEAGKALNATLRSFEDLRIDSASLKFQSLAPDTFTWTAKASNAAGAGTIVPEIGQVVELFLDGARKFRGHVMQPVVGERGVTVEVQGPWWWMQKIYLTSSQTIAQPVGSASTADRVKYVFESGDLKGMIETLLNRGITNGVPMIRGTVADMYDVTQVTLSNMTIANALAKLMARVPDSVAVFDYSAASGVLPTLKIARRNGDSAMTALTYTVGTDAIERLRISPRLDLAVTRVQLDYMDRHPTSGVPRLRNVASGTAETGKLQIVTVSGPEIVDFLPKDDYQTTRLQTGAAGAAISNAFVVANDPDLAAIRTSIGYPPGEIDNFLTYYVGANKVRKDTYFPSLRISKENGTSIPASALTRRYLLLSADLPAWAFDQWGGIRVKVTGTWLALWYLALQGTDTPSAAFEALRAGGVWGHNFMGANTIGSDVDKSFDWVARPFSFTAVLIKAVTGLPQNPPFLKSTRVYKQSDYAFISPPAGMAAGLKNSQNWTPWQGTFVLVADSVSGTNLLTRVINIEGAVTDCATMKAMAKSLSYDLINQRMEWELGAPARLDFATAAGRVPSSPQDVIIQL